jgi:hypothetical protein
MFGGTGAGLDGYRTQGGRTPFGQQYSIYPSSVGHAQESAKILRIFNAVQSQQQVRRAGCSWREKVFDGKKLLWVHQGHNALMSGSLGELRQLLARFLTDADTAVATEGNEPLQLRIFALARHHNVVKTPPAGLERFFDRV